MCGECVCAMWSPPPCCVCGWWGHRPQFGACGRGPGARACVCRSERPRMDRRGVYAPGSRLPSVYRSHVLSWSACARKTEKSPVERYSHRDASRDPLHTSRPRVDTDTLLDPRPLRPIPKSCGQESPPPRQAEHQPYSCSSGVHPVISSPRRAAARRARAPCYGAARHEASNSTIAASASVGGQG